MCVAPTESWLILQLLDLAGSERWEVSGMGLMNTASSLIPRPEVSRIENQARELGETVIQMYRYLFAYKRVILYLCCCSCCCFDCKYNHFYDIDQIAGHDF